MKYKLLTPTATAPKYQTAGAAAFDLHLDLVNGHDRSTVELEPGDRIMLSTGIAVELDHDEALMVMVRSSVGSKRGVGLANDVGLIDSDYRGELFVTLQNRGMESQVFRHAERVAQGLIVKLAARELRRVDELSATERGAGGHGSTGNT